MYYINNTAACNITHVLRQNLVTEQFMHHKTVHEPQLKNIIHGLNYHPVVHSSMSMVSTSYQSIQQQHHHCPVASPTHLFNVSNQMNHSPVLCLKQVYICCYHADNNTLFVIQYMTAERALRDAQTPLGLFQLACFPNN